MLHDLKTWPEAFEAVMRGEKTHEARKNDRGFAVGDVLVLREWAPHNPAECDWQATAKLAGNYTGRTLMVDVTHITQGLYGLPPDLAIMSIRSLPQTLHGVKRTADGKAWECACDATKGGVNVMLAIDDEEHSVAYALSLVAAELLTRGGDLADLPRRWAGVASPEIRAAISCSGNGNGEGCEHNVPCSIHGGEESPSCTCGKAPGTRGPHKAGCARRKAKGAPAPEAMADSQEGSEPCNTCGAPATESYPDPDAGSLWYCAKHGQKGAPDDGPEARIDRCARAIRTALAAKARSRIGLLAALRSAVPESNPAERDAAIDAEIAAGRVVEEGKSLAWAGG
jgi:hypothetical protein